MMVKNSYRLSSVLPSHTVSSPKRRSGRLARTRSESVQPPVRKNVIGLDEGAGRKGGRPSKKQVIQPHDNTAEQRMPEPETLATDGLGSRKRRSGGPPKLAPVVPGRVQAQLNEPALVVEEQESVVVKRKRWIPARKNVGEDAEEGGVGVSSGGVVKRRRSGLEPGLRSNGKWTRGQTTRDDGGSVVVGKRRGPPKVRRPSASGKPKRRPRKNAASPEQVSQQMVNEEPAKKTIDLIIKDAVDMLRPCIPPEKLQQIQELLASCVTPPKRPHL